MQIGVLGALQPQVQITSYDEAAAECFGQRQTDPYGRSGHTKPCCPLLTTVRLTTYIVAKDLLRLCTETKSFLQDGAT